MRLMVVCWPAWLVVERGTGVGGDGGDRGCLEGVGGSLMVKEFDPWL